MAFQYKNKQQLKERQFSLRFAFNTIIPLNMPSKIKKTP